MKCFIEKHADNASFMTTFFLKVHSVDSPVTRSVVISNLNAICKVFDLERLLTLGVEYSRTMHSQGIEKFLSLVGNHSRDSIPQVLERTLSQAANIKDQLFLPLVTYLLKHDVAVSDFCQSLTTLYLTSKVGQEPTKPIDWTRSATIEADYVHCWTVKKDCKNCQVVEQFLLDPTLEKQIFGNEVVDAGKNRRHYYLEIVKQVDSTWLITKTDKHWKGKHDKWSSELETFRTEMAKTDEEVLVRKLGAEKDNILRGECILHKPDDIPERGSPPAKRLRVEG